MVKWSPCYFLSLCFAILTEGCGKKIVDSTKRDPALDDRQYATAEDITLKAENDKNDTRISGIKNITHNGRIRIPVSIFVQEGNGGNYRAKLIFNKDLEGYEFYCLYKGGASQPAPDSKFDPQDFGKGLVYHFEACYNPDHQDINLKIEELEHHFMPVDENKQIELQILGAHPDMITKVQTILKAEWN